MKEKTKNYEASTKETKETKEIVNQQTEYSSFDEYFDEYAEENEAYFKNADMIL